MSKLIRGMLYSFLTSSVIFPAYADNTPTPPQHTASSPTPKTPSDVYPAAQHVSFVEAHIPANDEKSWITIGVTNGHTAATLNKIFDQTISDPHHENTDNPDFFTNIRPIVNALNAHKFTLDDLHTLIAEHQYQEKQGQAEELGPDLTDIIIDSATKIHNGSSAKEIVKEITAQQQAIDTAEKQEQSD